MGDKHEICWGKVIAGTAIAAGAVLLCTALFAPSLIGLGATAVGVGGAKIGAAAALGHTTATLGVGQTAGAVFSSIGNFILTQVSAMASWVATHQVASVAIGAAAGGVIADQVDRHSEKSADKIERQVLTGDQQSFAMREDMRKMQALMVARMQAQGYQPAMAMAGQQR